MSYNRVDSCNRDYMACKAPNTYDLILYRKALQTPVYDGDLGCRGDFHLGILSMSLNSTNSWETGQGVLTLRALVCLFVIEDYLFLLASSLNCISKLKSQISLHFQYHCPGLSGGLPLLLLQRQPFRWFPSSHLLLHTLPEGTL